MRIVVPLFAVLIVCAFVSSTTAHAEEPPPPSRNPIVAATLSVGITAALVGTGWYIDHSGDRSGWAASVWIPGLLLGPSVGHWYAGDVGWTGLAIRGAGAGLVLGAAGVWEAYGGETPPRESFIMAYLGIATLGAGVIHDFVSAPDAANRYNRRHAPSVAIAPWMQERWGGLVVAGTF